MRRLAALLFLLLGAATARAEIRWEVVRVLPHDSQAFTQGLFIADGKLYESTGLVGRSELRVMRLADGVVTGRQPIRADLFGEGIAPWGDRIISLTWRHGLGFVWRREDLRELASFAYAGEGWGLTSSAQELIMSDGTAELRFLDPATFAERRRVTVTWQGNPVRNLNELEHVDGAVFANIWYAPLIARIDPATGVIDDWINLAPLVAENIGDDPDAVLNGIAWDAQAGLLYVTGKNWPRLYVLRLLD
jgi:glutamine cyclotransferase